MGKGYGYEGHLSITKLNEQTMPIKIIITNYYFTAFRLKFRSMSTNSTKNWPAKTSYLTYSLPSAHISLHKHGLSYDNGRLHD